MEDPTVAKGLARLRVFSIGLPGRQAPTIPCPPTPDHPTGHGKPLPSPGGQEEEDEDEEEEEEDEEAAEEEEEEEEVTLVTRHKRHPELSEGQAIASVIIYRTLAGLLPEQYDTDKRSLRCHGGH